MLMLLLILYYSQVLPYQINFSYMLYLYHKHAAECVQSGVIVL